MAGGALWRSLRLCDFGNAEGIMGLFQKFQAALGLGRAEESAPSDLERLDAPQIDTMRAALEARWRADPETGGARLETDYAGASALTVRLMKLNISYAADSRGPAGHVVALTPEGEERMRDLHKRWKAMEAEARAVVGSFALGVRSTIPTRDPKFRMTESQQMVFEVDTAGWDARQRHRAEQACHLLGLRSYAHKTPEGRTIFAVDPKGALEIARLREEARKEHAGGSTPPSPRR